MDCGNENVQVLKTADIIGKSKLPMNGTNAAGSVYPPSGGVSLQDFFSHLIAGLGEIGKTWSLAFDSTMVYFNQY